MKTTRQYNKVCNSCRGSGYIPEPLPTSTSITRMCPACHGGGLVLVTEIFESPAQPEANKENEIISLVKTDICINFNMCEKCGNQYWHNKSYHLSKEKLLCPNCVKPIQPEAQDKTAEERIRKILDMIGYEREFTTMLITVIIKHSKKITLTDAESYRLKKFKVKDIESELIEFAHRVEMPTVTDEEITAWANSLNFILYDNFWEVAVMSAKAMRDGVIKSQLNQKERGE
jgi:hypothetical protein